MPFLYFVERITRLSSQLSKGPPDLFPDLMRLRLSNRSSFLVSYLLEKNKKGTNAFLFFCGADYETRTRYLHLGKVTLYRMS